MPAFQHAVDLGYTYLETDVHVTSDGVLVAFHDADLDRARAGAPARINELPWREVATARVGGREPIPLLEDLLGSFPEARVNIDCKAWTALAEPDLHLEASRLPRSGVPRQLQRSTSPTAAARVR